MKSKLSQSQRSAAWAIERALRGTSRSINGATRPSYGVRPPDRRSVSQGEPAELLLRRLGFNPAKNGAVGTVRDSIKVAADPNLAILRRLGFKDKDAVAAALATHALKG